MSEKNRLSRRQCRELIFKLLFAREFDRDGEPADFYENFIDVTEEVPAEYATNVFVGVCESMGELDAEIEGASLRWKLSRMSTSARCVLRMAVYEMTVCEVPPKVEINEAVEIIKSYDEDSAPSFVNGILNKIARDRGLIEA